MPSVTLAPHPTNPVNLEYQAQQFANLGFKKQAKAHILAQRIGADAPPTSGTEKTSTLAPEKASTLRRADSQASLDGIELTLRSASGERLTPEQKYAALRDEANILFAHAEKLHALAQGNKTKWQKSWPGVKNGIIATVIVAEIASIPILLVNIAAMCKPPHKGVVLSKETAPHARINEPNQQSPYTNTTYAAPTFAPPTLATAA